MVRASLLADPRVQGLLDLVAVVAGEPAVLDQKILGFSQAPPPFCAGVVGAPGGEGHLMCGAQPGLVLLADLEVQVTVMRFWWQRSAISRTVRPAVYIMSHSGCFETSQPTMAKTLVHRAHDIPEFLSSGGSSVHGVAHCAATRGQNISGPHTTGSAGGVTPVLTQ